MARAQFPSSIGLSIGALKQAAAGVGDWAALLYALIRFLSWSAFSVFRAGALVNTGTTFGRAPVLDGNGRLPAAVVPATVGGRRTASALPPELLGPEQAGVRWAELDVQYPSDTALQIGLKVTRGHLPATVAPEPLGGPGIGGLPGAVNVNVGSTAELDFTVSDEAARTSVSAHPETVATVTHPDSSGVTRRVLVRGVSAGVGAVRINAETADGGTQRSVVVNVYPVDEPLPVPVVTGQPASIAIATGARSEPFTLRTSITEGLSVFWVRSDDPDIARASLTGSGASRTLVVEGRSPGATELTVFVTAAGLTEGVIVPVTVTGGPEISGHPSSISVQEEETSAAWHIRSSVETRITEFSASSSNPATATVRLIGEGASRTLTVTGVADGSATVTIRVTAGGETGVARIPVTVTAAPETVPVISGHPSSVSVEKDEVSTPWAITSSVSEGITAFTAVSDDTDVATVSLTGSGATRSLIVTGVAVGSATVTITVTAAGETATVSFAVTVTAPTVQISGHPSQVGVQVGATAGPWAVTSSVSEGITAFTAVSDDTDVATVSLTGSGAARSLTVTGVGAGSATITISVTANGVTATATAPVKVTAPVPVISGHPSSVSVQVGKTSTPSTVRSSVSEGITAFTAVSDDTGVATVRLTGSGAARSLTVTGVATGSAEITLTVTAGGQTGTATVAITVTARPPAVAPTISGLSGSQTFTHSSTHTSSRSDAFTTSDGAATVSAVSSDAGVVAVFLRQFATPTSWSISYSVGGSTRHSGSATVTVTVSKDGASRDYSVSITVNAQPVSRPKITGLVTSRTIDIGQTVTDSFGVTGHVGPPSVSGGGNIADASLSGNALVITGRRAGSTTVVVSASNSAGTTSVSVSVTVRSPVVQVTISGLSDRSIEVTESNVSSTSQSSEGFTVSPSSATCRVSSTRNQIFGTVPYLIDNSGRTRRISWSKAQGLAAGSSRVTVTASSGGSSVSASMTIRYFNNLGIN